MRVRFAQGGKAKNHSKRGLVARRGVALAQDPETQAEWAKCLCVLTSGFIETSLQEIYLAYAHKKSSRNVANFVDDRLRAFRNLKTGRITELATKFTPEWESNIVSAITPEMRDAVDSIIENRNKIAHGVNVGLTLGRMKRYYENAVKVVELVEKAVLA